MNLFYHQKECLFSYKVTYFALKANWSIWKDWKCANYIHFFSRRVAVMWMHSFSVKKASYLLRRCQGIFLFTSFKSRVSPLGKGQCRSHRYWNILGFIPMARALPRLCARPGADTWSDPLQDMFPPLHGGRAPIPAESHGWHQKLAPLLLSAASSACNLRLHNAHKGLAAFFSKAHTHCGKKKPRKMVKFSKAMSFAHS